MRGAAPDRGEHWLRWVKSCPLQASWGLIWEQECCQVATFQMRGETGQYSVGAEGAGDLGIGEVIRTCHCKGQASFRFTTGFGPSSRETPHRNAYSFLPMPADLQGRQLRPSSPGSSLTPQVFPPCREDHGLEVSHHR